MIRSVSLKNVELPINVYRIAVPTEEQRGAKAASLPEKHVGEDTHRVAVLPFANMSPDPNDEYFADGLTEEVISTLSGIPQLEVISRTSVMQYRKNPKPVAWVAKELHVGTILEGSVRKAGNSLRITVQMIDSSRDRHLWAETYDREFRDVFAVQSDIARKVTESMMTSLGKVRVETEKNPTVNMAAYSNYLRGISQAHDRPSAALDSIKFLQEAIKQDPDFAAAYAALGNTYVLFAGDYIAPGEAYSKAESLIEKALELEENSSDAHLAKGNLAMQHHLDWQLAEREFRSAISSNPSNALAHSWYSVLLRVMGKIEGALEEAWRAHGLDPLSTWSKNQLLECFLMKHDWKNGVSLAEEMARLEPEDTTQHLRLARVYFRAGRVRDAQRALRMALKANMRAFEKLELARTLALLGNSQEAHKMLLEIEGERPRQYYSHTRLASAYSMLGESERALELLEEGFEQDKFGFVLDCERFEFDPIRETPRFLSLQARLNKRGETADLGSR